MNRVRSRYHGHRFPPEIIGHDVSVYPRFCLSFRDVEDLLAQRGIMVSYEAIRRWCWKFGPDYARRLKKKQGRLGDAWYLDELLLTINGQIVCCSLAAIRVPPSGSFADGGALKASNHSGSSPTSWRAALSIGPRCRPESILRRATFAEIDSSPTLEISVLRGLAKDRIA